MGKIKQFDVIFSSPHGAFMSGTAVEGYVVLDLAKPMKMECLRMHFSGLGKVHWWKNRGNNNTTHYRASETYFQHTVNLFGAGNRTSMHPAGKHTYPFTFPINSALPSSFEGQYGYVRYLTKISIIKPWKANRHITKPFSVLSVMDLNREPHLQSSHSNQKSVDVGWCCCVSGHVQASVVIDRKGYVPGESIRINARIQNDSNTTVDSSRAFLLQHVTFYGRSDGIFSSNDLKPKHHSSVVASVGKGQVYAGTTCVWEDVPLQIPALPPSRLLGCQIIDVSYTFKFEIDPGWTSSSFELNNEIVLGTVPFRPVITQQPRAMPSAPPTSDVLALESINIPPPSYSVACGDMPPSYEESMFGHVQFSEENEAGQNAEVVSYAPVYTVYNTLH